jgi:hypothetical protein
MPILQKTPNAESKVNDSKEFRTPPHNLAIEQAVLINGSRII